MRPSRRRTLAFLTLGTVLVLPVAGPALAQDATITHRQSVLTELDAEGVIREARFFTQLTAEGSEQVGISDQPTAGLRNLEAFTGVGQDGDAVTYPSGFSRTVADFDGEQPVTIEVAYTLDGEPIRPRDLVGRSGALEVTYRVTNTTAAPRELTYKDATGVERTETVDVAIPMVGSLTLTLDQAFTDIAAPGAAVVGDGRGATKLQWSLLLFAPLGSEVVEATWSADVEDATVPATRIQILPVDRSTFGSLESTAAAYRGAADDTYALTQGAIKIDRNLTRLAKGAADLLAGLGQLKDGADQLAAGLTDAADGSGELAAGLDQLATGAADLRAGVAAARAGSDDLAAGLDTLATGAGELKAGLSQARDGGGALATGLTSLDGGAAQLLGGLQELKQALNEGLPEATDGVAQLASGVDSVIAGIGTTSKADTLLNGLAQLDSGLGRARSGAGDLADGTDAVAAGVAGKVVPGIAGIRDGAAAMIQSVDKIAGCNVATLLDDHVDTTNNTPCGARDLLEFIDTALIPAVDPLNPAFPADVMIDGLLDGLYANIGTNNGDQTTLLGGLGLINGGAGQLLAGLGAIPASCAAAEATAAAETASPLGGPSVLTALTLIRCGAQELRAGLGDAGSGVGRISTGVSNPAAFTKGTTGYNPTCDKTTAGLQPCGVLQALQLVRGGLDALGGGLGDALKDVNAGLGSTTQPGETLLFGMGQLSAGATTAATGASDLSSGLVQLDDGAGRLAAGAAEAAAGAGALADGLGQIDDGAGRLAVGAGDAAAGADQLAAGLPDAQDGAQQIADGLALAQIGGGQVAAGAAELSSKGTAVLAEQVNDASAGANLLVARLTAVDERGRTEALPYPAAAGAVASVVYQYDLAGIDLGALGETARTILAVALLAAAGAVGMFGRRRMGVGA